MEDRVINLERRPGSSWRWVDVDGGEKWRVWWGVWWRGVVLALGLYAVVLLIAIAASGGS